MEWKNAKIIADQRLTLLPLPPGELHGLSVQLFDFADEKLYQFEHGAAPATMSLADYRIVLLCLRRALVKRGARVLIVVQTIDAVMQWNTSTYPPPTQPKPEKMFN